MDRLRVTLDTNTIKHRGRIESACAGFDVELAYTTVTDRETEGTSYATTGASVMETGVWNESRWDQFVWGGPVRESAVIGKWRLGKAVLGSDESPATLERILEIISDRGFPPPGAREALTVGQRHQLRDAMVLEAHAREDRDVLISEDTKGFVKHGRRERLEALCRTRIMTVDEFCAEVSTLVS